ncbi:helix-turn-helix transcriptional regulator [Pedobacter petrophilus]|uniref:helix-turn-helix domain-containing protein n=1 Tax=Pedobacter petrophilus TaxID=1908241 RepID=UPI00142EE8B7
MSKSQDSWKEVGGSFKKLPRQENYLKERRDRYNFSFSDAEVFQINTRDLYIVYTDSLFKQHQLHFRPDGNVPDMVKLRFTLSGSGNIYNQVNKQQYLFRSNQQNIIYMPELEGTGEYDTTCNYRFFEVHFTKEKFLQIAENSSGLLQVLADRLDGGQFAQIHKQSLPISWAMQNCIHEIIHCSYTGKLKLLFIESKCTELLVLQAEAFEKSVTKNNNLLHLSAYDINCIYAARDYLIENINEPPGMAQLVKLCGINEFKLKQGFKNQFDKSIFAYVSDHKLNQAKELLLEGHSIKSVAFQLGYSSVQHFGNAFRKKFAVSPGKLKV